MRHWLFGMAAGFVFTLSAAAQQMPAEGRGLSPVPGDADAFIYYRYLGTAPPNGISPSAMGPAPVTMYLARVTENGIESKEIGNGVIGSPVCAAAGKIYLENGAQLKCLEVATGKVTEIDEALGGPVMRDGKMYFTSLHYGEHLCVLDPASLTGMNLIRWPSNPAVSSIHHMVLSPDGKHLAWMAMPNVAMGRSSISGWAIGVFDLDGRTNKVLVTRLAYAPPAMRSLGSSPNLIAWRDDRTLLTVTNDPPAARGGATTGDFLTAIDIGSGKLTRLTRMPVVAGGVEFFPPQADSDLAIVLTSPPGGGTRQPAPLRFALDLATNTLHEARTRVGQFALDQSQGVMLAGKAIDVAVRDARFSPDGNRLLYTRRQLANGAPAAELHCYDGETETDRVVGGVPFGLPFGWVSTRDLAAPAVPPQPPAGYVSLEKLRGAPDAAAPTVPTAPPTGPAKAPLKIGLYGG